MDEIKKLEFKNPESLNLQAKVSSQKTSIDDSYSSLNYASNKSNKRLLSDRPSEVINATRASDLYSERPFITRMSEARIDQTKQTNE